LLAHQPHGRWSARAQGRGDSGAQAPPSAAAVAGVQTVAEAAQASRLRQVAAQARAHGL